MLGNETKKQTYWNQTVRIPKPDIISTFFLFGRHHNITKPEVIDLKPDEVEFEEDIFGAIIDLGDKVLDEFDDDEDSTKD